MMRKCKTKEAAEITSGGMDELQKLFDFLA
jgi:hypothetical protein